MENRPRKLNDAESAIIKSWFIGFDGKKISPNQIQMARSESCPPSVLETIMDAWDGKSQSDVFQNAMFNQNCTGAIIQKTWNRVGFHTNMVLDAALQNRNCPPAVLLDVLKNVKIITDFSGSVETDMQYHAQYNPNCPVEAFDVLFSKWDGISETDVMGAAAQNKNCPPKLRLKYYLALTHINNAKRKIVPAHSSTPEANMSTPQFKDWVGK